MKRTLVFVAGTALLLGAVAGCSDSGSDSTTSPTPSATPSASATESASPTDLPSPPTETGDWNFVAGMPDGVMMPDGFPSAGVGWAEDGTLWVVLFGSSSNPTIVKEVTADGQALDLSIEAVDPGAMATADFVPTTSYVEVPDTVDRAAPVEITLEGIGTVTVTADTPGWIAE